MGRGSEAPSSTPPAAPAKWVNVTLGNKTVGRVSPDGKVYWTTRDSSVHLVRKWDAYGLQAMVYADLIKRGVEVVRLDETRRSGEVRRYEVPMAVWAAHSFREVLQAKAGLQVFLRRARMQPYAVTLVPGKVAHPEPSQDAHGEGVTDDGWLPGTPPQTL